MQFEIRTYDPVQDLSFVRDSWALSIRDHFPFSSFQPQELTRVIRGRLASARTKAVVGVLEGLAVGWAASIGQRLLYCYVKADYRRRGLGSALVRALHLDPQRLDVLVWTRSCRKINARNPGRVRIHNEMVP